jgi:ATP/maltotriose-dependent transcriptional regulator MalT
LASQTQSFALTKIQPPRARASLVARERLEERMTRAALGRPLVLLAAPAGFGKTAALARLIERLRGRASIAWISADVDDDPLGPLACLIAAGDSNKLIARAFDLSPHTVKRHVANILDKLAVQSRGQAAAWYLARRTN